MPVQTREIRRDVRAPMTAGPMGIAAWVIGAQGTVDMRDAGPLIAITVRKPAHGIQHSSAHT